MTAKVIEKLLEIQNFHEYSDRKMGKRLGVSRQRWQQIKTNPQIAGNIVSPILTGIINTYPELTKDLLSFIKNPSNGASHDIA